jgi:hypothetical protein
MFQVHALHNNTQIYNSILLYEFYKTLDCDTSWLGHDERSEECSNKTSVTGRLIKSTSTLVTLI